MSQTYTSMTSFPLGTRPAGTKISTPVASPAIMCCGDSLTYGYGTGALESYRQALHALLTRGGLSPTWIGPFQDGTAPWDHMNGIVGTNCDVLANDPVNGIANRLATYSPDLIILWIGSNDAADATLTANFGTNLGNFLSTVKSLKPACRTIVCKLQTQGSARTTQLANIPTINSTIASVVATAVAGGQLVTTCDLSGVIDPAGGDRLAAEALTNWIHLCNEAQWKIADAIYPVAMNACGYDAAW